MKSSKSPALIALVFVFIMGACQSQHKAENGPSSELQQAGVSCKDNLYYYELTVVKTRVAPPEIATNYKFNRQTECDNAAIVEKAKISESYPQAQFYCVRRCYQSTPAILPAPGGPNPEPQILPIPPSQGGNQGTSGQTPYMRCVRNSWINICTSDGGFIKCNTEAAGSRPRQVHLRLNNPIYKKCPEACRGAGNGYNDYGC